VHLVGFIIRKKSSVVRLYCYFNPSSVSRKNCPVPSDVSYRTACVTVTGRDFFFDSPHLYFLANLKCAWFLNKKLFWGFLVISSLFYFKPEIFPILYYKLCWWRCIMFRRTVHRAPASGASCKDYLYEINLLTVEKCSLM